jgi:hypothetical protein
MKLFLPTLFLLAAFQLKAQVTLNTSPYTENFNGMAINSTTLPNGFTVKKNATATALGTDTTLNGINIPGAWKQTGRGFKNYASNTTLTDPGTDSATQAGSADRALGVRQISAFGDSGAAFVFQIANTTGKSNFQLSFKLQSLDTSSPRTTTWIVDYASGASPTVFTPVTTSPAALVTGNKIFSNTGVTVDFGTALDNISDVVYIRVVTVKKSIGSGNRASTAIDDWSLSWSGTSAINDLFSRDSYVKLVGNTPDKLSLQFNKSINNKIQLQLTSLNGQVVYSRAIGKVTEGQTESIPMAVLPKGIYFVSILSKDGNFGTKISH